MTVTLITRDGWMKPIEFPSPGRSILLAVQRHPSAAWLATPQEIERTSFDTREFINIPGTTVYKER